MRCNLHDYDIMEETKLEAARKMLMENVPMDKIASWQKFASRNCATTCQRTES